MEVCAWPTRTHHVTNCSPANAKTNRVIDCQSFDATRVVWLELQAERSFNDCEGSNCCQMLSGLPESMISAQDRDILSK